MSNLGHHALSFGKLEEAEAYLREGAALLRQHRHADVMAGTVNNLAVVAVELDRDDALEVLDEALAAALRVGERRMEGIVRSNRGAWLLGLGQVEAAEGEYRASVEALIAMSDPIHAGIAAVPLAILLQQTGRAAEGETILRARLAAVESWPPPLEGELRARLGAVLADLGRAEEGLEQLDSAHALGAGEAGLRVARGHWHLATGDRDAAKAEFEVDATRSADLRIAVAALEGVLGMPGG